MNNFIVASRRQKVRKGQVNLSTTNARTREESGSEKIYLNIKEAANYLRLAKQTVYQLTSTRKIPHYKVGRRLVFERSQLDQWINFFNKKTFNLK